MNDNDKDKLLVNAHAAMDAIRAKYGSKVVKDFVFAPLVRIGTGEQIGFAVKIVLYSRYSYNEEMVTEWKRLLKADDWFFSIKLNQLSVTFKVRYENGGDD